MPIKKLTLDARMLGHSGIGTYIKSLIGGLGKTFDLTLIGNTAELGMYAPGAHIIPFTAPIYSIKEQFLAFKSTPADIFWSPHYNIPLLPMRAKRRIVTIHDVYHLAYYHHLSKAQKAYSKIMIGAAVKMSDAIITVSEFSKKEIIRYTGCPTEKIHVIYNGVRKNSVIRLKEELQAKYRLPEKYILFVGNVKPHKNLKKLLEAYLLLPGQLREEYKIVIAGKKEGFITGDRELLQWADADAGLRSNIFFSGYIDEEDMDSIYHYASLFVFPSVYEGFGLPPLEAMQNSCPVISSGAASMPEICRDAVLYFDPLSASSICEKIENVLTDPSLRESLIKKGIEHCISFSWERSIEEHEVLLSSLS